LAVRAIGFAKKRSGGVGAPGITVFATSTIEAKRPTAHVPVESRSIGANPCLSVKIGASIPGKIVAQLMEEKAPIE